MMDNIREKLVALLLECDSKFDVLACYDEQTISNSASILADHLIANGVTVQEWIPVTDRLPRDERQVLVYYGFGDFRVRFNGILSYYCCDPNPQWQRESEGLKVTHWMPLPAPPKGE